VIHWPSLSRRFSVSSPVQKSLAVSTDAVESHSAYQDLWSSLARSSSSGEVVIKKGVLVTAAGGKWPVMNTAFLSSPVPTEADLRERILVAKRYFEPKRRLWRSSEQKKRSWLFIVFNHWLNPPIQPEQVFRDSGLCYAQNSVGMQTTRLRAPTRSVPELQYRLVDDDSKRVEFSDINADSYGLSTEWTNDVAAWTSGWPLSKIRLYIAYSGKQAVSSAMVHLSGDVALLGWVATRRAHQSKGYGEAISRYALGNAEEHWQFRKIIVHSTPDGLSLYRKLGFSEVTSFKIYLAN
jgi:GNAT superfamily N-acetyltransferase